MTCGCSECLENDTCHLSGNNGFGGCVKLKIVRKLTDSVAVERSMWLKDELEIVVNEVKMVVLVKVVKMKDLAVVFNVVKLMDFVAVVV